MSNKIYTVFLATITVFLFSGCLNSEPELCWQTMSHHALDEDSCLKVAEESFSEVCNEVFFDRDWCLELWENTQVSFDAVEQECYITFPIECGGT